MLMLYLKMYRRGTDKPPFFWGGGFKQLNLCKKAIVFKLRGNKKELNFGKSNGFLNEGVVKSN